MQIHQFCVSMRNERTREIGLEIGREEEIAHIPPSVSSRLVEGGQGTLRWTGRGWEELELAKPAVSSWEREKERGRWESWCSLCRRLVRVKRNQWGKDWRRGTDTFPKGCLLCRGQHGLHGQQGPCEAHQGSPSSPQEETQEGVWVCLRVFFFVLVTVVVLAFRSIINCSKNSSRCHGVTLLESGWMYSLPFLPHGSR